MELKEFKERVAVVRVTSLKLRHEERGYHRHLCEAICDEIAHIAKMKFVELFKPRKAFQWRPWYGSNFSRLSLWRRLRVLKKFEKICIKNNYYEEF